MTLYHVIALALALAAPLLCGIFDKCSTASFEKIFYLSSSVIVGVVGHAGQNKVTKEKKVPKPPSEPK